MHSDIRRVELSDRVIDSLTKFKRPNFPFGRQNGTVMNKLLDKAYSSVRECALSVQAKRESDDKA